MKTTIKIWAIGLILCTLAMTSCTKEGPEGPVGPIGPQGEQGLQGEQGTEGTEGQAGAVNVMYSEWLNQDFNFLDGAKFKAMKVDEVRLTNEFFNEGGIVLGFFRFSRNVQYTLPYISNLRNTMRSITAISFSDRGEVRFSLESTDDSELNDNEVNGVGADIQAQFKYVMIPGGISLSGKSHQVDFHKMTYEEVMDYFALDY